MLIAYVNKTNYKLANFIRHIDLNDTSITFSQQSDSKSFSELNKSFNNVLNQMREIKIEKATQAEILRTVIEQIDVGLIAQDSSGKIRFINQAANEILLLPNSIKNIQSLDLYYENISSFLQKIEPHEQKLKTLNAQGERLAISFKVSIIRLPNEELRFYIFQNIKAELDEQELDAWQKLIRVLTHEIMNSITPITTLSHTINMLLSTGDNNEKLFSEEIIDDAISCASLIEERSNGLMRFVQQYRQLTQSFELHITSVNLKTFLENVVRFLQSALPENLEITVETEPNCLQLDADIKLVEQVLINLIKNASEATKNTNSPEIKIVARENKKGRKQILIIDNGTGIEEGNLSKIFVPFYTTKTDGSGIGLSLSKQIIQQHGGTISVKSIVKQHTTFTLTF